MEDYKPLCMENFQRSMPNIHPCLVDEDGDASPQHGDILIYKQHPQPLSQVLHYHALLAVGVMHELVAQAADHLEGLVIPAPKVSTARGMKAMPSALHLAA